MGTQTPGVIRFWSTIVQRKSRVCFDSKNIMAQKRCVFMIYLCTFSNIILFTSLAGPRSAIGRTPDS